ncbi:MAG: Na/Pi cotransporter family protein, partial [Victivallales bacterium]|nr:Na/Pi cotransporter family protein [Victivallales bacterium]
MNPNFCVLTRQRQGEQKKRYWRRFLIALLAVFIIFGCGHSEEKEAAKIIITSGEGQCGFQGETLSEDLRIAVLGPQRPYGWGSGQRHPASKVRILVEPLRTSKSTAHAEPSEGVTDVAGTFSCKLTLGEEFGDQYFKVSCPDFPHLEPVLVHAVSGVKIENGFQEVMAGNELPMPVILTVKERKTPTDEFKPVVGIPLYFQQFDGKAAKLSQTQALTHYQGEVKVYITVPENFTGSCNFMVEMGDGYKYTDNGMADSDVSPEYRSRGMKISILVLSRWGIIIGVLGGLAIFIFGMSMMSNGLQQIAGERLKTLLQLFAGTRFKAVLAGIVVTSLIQSSGATTVMVVGFVNAQLLNLMQSVGIIYGAAIGTTITAQMVSFKLDGMALPTICIGVVILMLSVKSQWKGVGNTLLGFGLLFFGMMMMSREMSALAEFPGFMAFFNLFDCSPKNGYMPITAILGTIVVGTILTVIVQSSSATVGLTIALAEAGLLNFYTAIPLILGDNIGSTITGHCAALAA